MAAPTRRPESLTSLTFSFCLSKSEKPHNAPLGLQRGNWFPPLGFLGKGRPAAPKDRYWAEEGKNYITDFKAVRNPRGHPSLHWRMGVPWSRTHARLWQSQDWKLDDGLPVQGSLQCAQCSQKDAGLIGIKGHSSNAGVLNIPWRYQIDTNVEQLTIGNNWESLFIYNHWVLLLAYSWWRGIEGICRRGRERKKQDKNRAWWPGKSVIGPAFPCPHPSPRTYLGGLLILSMPRFVHRKVEIIQLSTRKVRTE